MKIKEYKVFPTKIKDKKELLSAVEDFGLNFCKGSIALRKDIDCAESAIKSDPFSIAYMPQEVLENDRIKTAIKDKHKYLEKYLHPLADNKLNKVSIELIELRNRVGRQLEQERQEERIVKGKDLF